MDHEIKGAEITDEHNIPLSHDQTVLYPPLSVLEGVIYMRMGVLDISAPHIEITTKRISSHEPGKIMQAEGTY